MDGAAQTGRRAERDVHIVDAVIETRHRIESLVLPSALFVDFRS
jgi:hypothetical protein